MQVYADNAATTRMSDRAVQAMLPLLQENFGNPSSLHSVGQRAKEALENARDSIAADLGVSPKEIYFTSGGSEADNQAIRSAAAMGRRKGKTKIISSAFEHHAVLHTLAALEKEGFTVELLPVHENGIVRPAELEAALDENTCLVTIMAANNEIGTLQPVAEIFLLQVFSLPIYLAEIIIMNMAVLDAMHILNCQSLSILAFLPDIDLRCCLLFSQSD